MTPLKSSRGQPPPLCSHRSCPLQCPPPRLLLVHLASGAQVRSQEAGQGDWEGLVHTQAGAPSPPPLWSPWPQYPDFSPPGFSTGPISWHQA